MRARHVVPVLSILLAAVLTGCSSSQPAGGSESAGATGSPKTPATTTSPQAGSYKAKLALVGAPAVTANGKDILVTVQVTNEGKTAFGSVSEPHNVNLGAHAVDASNKKVVNDLARGNLPQIAPGATAQASILLPVSQTLGYRAEILPVEEGVAWFDQWGTQPLVVGPFKACANASMGTACDASGKPLPTTSASH